MVVLRPADQSLHLLPAPPISIFTIQKKEAALKDRLLWAKKNFLKGMNPLGQSPSNKPQGLLPFLLEEHGLAALSFARWWEAPRLRETGHKDVASDRACRAGSKTLDFYAHVTYERGEATGFSVVVNNNNNNTKSGIFSLYAHLTCSRV